MVEALEERIQRDARFAADLGHELRSPLTTLVASVQIIQRRRDDLPERTRRAVDLVSTELDRFQRTLEDLSSWAGSTPASAARSSRASTRASWSG